MARHAAFVASRAPVPRLSTNAALSGWVIPAFINAGAGNLSLVRDVLGRAGGFDARITAPDRITQAVRDAIRAGATRVLAAGGDGTVSAAAAAVARTGVELAILPSGTFNHFARDHGIPEDLDAAATLARDGHATNADLAWVNGRAFLNTSSVGVYANFVRVRERLEPRCGYWIASGLAAARTLVRVRPFQLTFETDGVQRVYSTPLAFIGVGERDLRLPTLGGRADGGHSGLHVLIVRGRTRARLLAVALAGAARGTRAVSRTSHLDSFLVPRCTIEQRHDTLALDGEVVTMPSPLTYEFGGDVLRVVTTP